jgi:hypothetical protein
VLAVHCRPPAPPPRLVHIPYRLIIGFGEAFGAPLDFAWLPLGAPLDSCPQHLSLSGTGRVPQPLHLRCRCAYSAPSFELKLELRDASDPKRTTTRKLAVPRYEDTRPTYRSPLGHKNTLRHAFIRAQVGAERRFGSAANHDKEACSPTALLRCRFRSGSHDATKSREW